MSARDAIEPLARLFGFDAHAVAGRVAWRGRGGAVDATLGAADLVSAEGEPGLSAVRAQETDLPAAIELGFTDGEGEYARAAVGSRRLAGSSRREAAVDVAAVMNRADAQRLADGMLQDIWAARDVVEFTLSPRAIDVAPGDVLAIGAGDSIRLVRVSRIVDGAARRVSADTVEPSVFRGRPASWVDRRRHAPPAVAGPPFAVLLDLPASSARPEPLQYLAVAADPWPGAVAVWRSAGGASFTLQTVVDLPAIVGRTLGLFPPGPVWRWDRVSSLEVVLSSGGLATLDEEAALAGGNLFAVLGPEGACEIVTARAAMLIGERTYRLSGFLRGLGGTEAQAGRSLAAGATIVRLDGAVAPLTTSLTDLGGTVTYRVGPADRDHSDPSYVELSGTVGSLALRPLAPVHVRAERSTAGIRVAWIRRTRTDGDAWEVAEVPLGEESEAYRLDILSAGVVVRSWAVDGAATALYAPADEMADFGSVQTHLSLRLSQVSRVAGPGAGFSAVVPIL